jgi:hypothetical protein
MAIGVHVRATEAPMATDKPTGKNEPQSYGSGKEWVTGKTGEKVNPQKSTPPPEHQDFYDSRRESEESAQHQGGRTSPVQLAENAEAQSQSNASAGENEHQPVTKVTTNAGGSKHDSFFRKRDYPD